MADPATLKEIGTELAPAPPGHEHGSLTAWIQDLIFTVDHKKLGFLYLGAGWVFFVAGGILALGIRTQIAVPNNHFMDAEAFNQAFTMHGTTMIFKDHRGAMHRERLIKCFRVHEVIIRYRYLRTDPQGQDSASNEKHPTRSKVQEAEFFMIDRENQILNPSG